MSKSCRQPQKVSHPKEERPCKALQYGKLGKQEGSILSRFGGRGGLQNTR